MQSRWLQALALYILFLGLARLQLLVLLLLRVTLVRQLQFQRCVLFSRRLFKFDHLCDPLLLNLVQVSSYHVVLFLNFASSRLLLLFVFEFGHFLFTKALVALDSALLFFEDDLDIHGARFHYYHFFWKHL